MLDVVVQASSDKVSRLDLADLLPQSSQTYVLLGPTIKSTVNRPIGGRHWKLTSKALAQAAPQAENVGCCLAKVNLLSVTRPDLWVGCCSLHEIRPLSHLTVWKRRGKENASPKWHVVNDGSRYQHTEEARGSKPEAFLKSRAFR